MEPHHGQVEAAPKDRTKPESDGTTAFLECRRLWKTYGNVTAVSDLSLGIDEGEFVTLLGPSGCGKTTTLRMIAGYTEQSRGQVLLRGKDITRLPPQKRDMGMVFQAYALFPHMTIERNVAFSLHIRNWPREKIAARVNDMLALVGLSGVNDRYPHQLSGGQQQRVALARALAYSPRVLLMDEPMGALDVKLREQMQLEVRRIQKELGITTLHVTHDQEEALSMSDRVVVMQAGQIVQVGTPKDLYEQPNSIYVADFVGKINLLRGRVRALEGDHCRFTTTERLSEGTVPEILAACGQHLQAGAEVWVGVRPEYMKVADEQRPYNCVRGRVQLVKFIGSQQYLDLDVGTKRVFLALDPTKAHREGQVVWVHWPPEKTLILAQ